VKTHEDANVKTHEDANRCRAVARPVLCEPRPAAAAAADTAAAADATAGAEATASTPAADGNPAEQQERLPDTYDDTDLYEQLLKEFLDAAAPGAGLALQRVSTNTDR